MGVRIAALAVVVALVCACSSSRKAVSPTVTTGTQQGVTSVSDARVELRQILDGYGEWQRLRVPVTVRLSKPKSITISGTAVMERGKSIFITLKYFGFEIGNLYLTNDSVTVVDKFNKQYVSESTSGFLGGFPVNISNVQDMLTGRIFVLSTERASASDLKKADVEIVNAGTWSLVPDPKKSGPHYGFMFSPVNVLSALIVQSGNHNPVTCRYQTPVATAAGPMTSAVSVDYTTGKTSIDATLEWNWNKARTGNGVELRRPSLSSKYKRITASEITKMISRL